MRSPWGDINLFRHIPTRLVLRCLGVLLLSAAALKLNGLAVDPVGPTGLFAATAIQVAIVEFEILLALWLLWGVLPLGSWLISFGVFLMFAAVSAWQGWIGRASCGCFGQLSVNPWWAFALDLGVLIALILGRPDLEAFRQPKTLLANLVPAVVGSVGAVLVLLALAGVATHFYGSPEGALARLRGERISLYPRTVDVGAGVPGEERTASVEVVNRTNHPVRLIGGAPD